MIIKLVLHTVAARFPLRISAEQALAFWYRYEHLRDDYVLMASGWRLNEIPGEEDWFEELTDDELDDEDFLEDFKEATLQLWKK